MNNAFWGFKIELLLAIGTIIAVAGRKINDLGQRIYDSGCRHLAKERQRKH